MKTLLTALALLLFAGLASADSIWQYQGNAVGDPLTAANPCQCALSGSVTFDASWHPLSWDFTDGTHMLTQANSSGVFNPFDGASTVPFAEWFVSIAGNNGWTLRSQFYGSGFEATDLSSVAGIDFLYVQGNRGSWVDGPVATPEPGTLLLLGAGLAVLSVKRRRKPADTTVWEPLS